MNESTLFLRNFTCIDHAYISDIGLVVGGSFHQEVFVTGGVEEHEQVVVDFSKVKGLLKKHIDAKEDGFDHKLWIIEGYSQCSYVEKAGVMKIKTPLLEISLPSNAVKVIKDPKNNNFFNVFLWDGVESAMSDFLMTKLKPEVPFLKEIVVRLEKRPFSSDATTFTYFHGLKNSSSWGCQNIAHGHLSFVECVDADGFRVFDAEELIQSFLSNALLVFDENLTERPELGCGKIQYETERGHFSLKWNPLHVKSVVMDRETTVENILDFVCEKFDYFLKWKGVERVFLSEGLQKGAVKVLN